MSLCRSKSFGSGQISRVTIDTRDYLLNKISKKDVSGPCNLCLLYDAFFAIAQSILLNCQDSCCLSLKGSSWISLQSSIARAAKQTHSITPELMLCPGTAAHKAILNLKTDKQRMPSRPLSDDLWISILVDRWHSEAYYYFATFLIRFIVELDFSSQILSCYGTDGEYCWNDCFLQQRRLQNVFVLYLQALRWNQLPPCANKEK